MEATGNAMKFAPCSAYPPTSRSRNGLQWGRWPDFLITGRRETKGPVAARTLVTWRHLLQLYREEDTVCCSPYFWI
jgi:hypothetical protein